MLISFFFFFCFEGNAKTKAISKSQQGQIRLGNLKDSTVLAHSVCAYRAVAEKKLDHILVAEGDICPVGGGECVYYAVLNIGGKDMRLKRTVAGTSDSASIFQSEGEDALQLTVDQFSKIKSKLTILTLLQKDGKKNQVHAKADCGD